MDNKTFEFPEGVITITEKMIPAAIREQITSVVIPDSVRYIDEVAFKGCKSLQSIVIPEGVVKISWRAFRECESLRSVVIPQSVKVIGRGCFGGCKSLNSAVLEGKNTELEDPRTVFYGCSNLTSFSLPTDHLYYTMKNGLLLSKNSAEVLACMCRYETIEIPDGVEIIAQCAFDGNDVLRRVVFPDTLKTIDFAAFFNCSALENVVIPSSVKEVGEEAFCQCHSLASVTILGNPGVGTGAFGECEALTSIESKFELDEDAFWPHWNGC